MNEEIKRELTERSDSKYKDFSSSLVPNSKNMLGVRLPELRKMAKEIAKSDWETVLSDTNDLYFEETMLRGMIIGYAKMDLNEKLEYIESFIPLIDTWSVCDCFCASLKFVQKNQDTFWGFIKPYLKSSKEFEIRFATVIMLDYFICDKYIDRVLAEFDKMKLNDYYAKMAVAWALSVCFIKFPEKTLEYLKKSTLDNFTYNKSLQKITESYRVDNNAKNMIRSMKRMS